MAGTTNFYGISYPTSTDYVKDGATAMQTIATGFDSVVAIPTYNNQTGTSYTFVLADTGKVVTASNASAVTFTIPPQSSVVWTDSTSLRVTNLGAGNLTIAGGSGVTVTNSSASIGQYQSATIIRTGSNAWTVVPNTGGALTLVKAQNIGTAVSSVNVTNAFSTAYDYYKIIIGGTGVGSTGLGIQLKLGNSTTGYYMTGIYTFYNSSGSGTSFQNNTTAFLLAGWAGTSNITMNVDLVSPAHATWTKYSSKYTAATDSTYQDGVHQVSTGYTDFTLTTSSGTITGGTVLVYGYKNS